jgi:hypothetical protein
MFGLPIEIAGTIVAAVIAAVISLAGLIISKENKVSEFRQAWIDSLREEVAAVLTHAHVIYMSYLLKVNQQAPAATWQKVREDLVNLNSAGAKIKLRLNPKEESSIAVLRALEVHEKLFPNEGAIPDLDTLESSESKLLTCTQVVLKEEWRRVKWGEYFYRAVTLGTAFLVIGGMYLLFKPATMLSSFTGHRNEYRLVERADSYVDREGREASDMSHDHDVVHLVLTHDGHKIYGLCELDPNASCGLRPLRNYRCVVGRDDDMMNAPMPLSDLTCTDGDGRKVYLYVSKEE